MEDNFELYFLLSPEKQALYDALVYAEEDISELEQLLYEQKHAAYTASTAYLVSEFGIDKEVSEADTMQIRMQAQEEAEGIADTYARDLLQFLYKLEQEEIDDGNLESSAYFWNQRRSEYKNTMIALHNIVEWTAKAVLAYFVVNAALKAYAELLPKVPVICEECQKYVSMGKVPVSSVLEALGNWPPHLNCIHSWRITKS